SETPQLSTRTPRKVFPPSIETQFTWQALDTLGLTPSSRSVRSPASLISTCPARKNGKRGVPGPVLQSISIFRVAALAAIGMTIKASSPTLAHSPTRPRCVCFMTVSWHRASFETNFRLKSAVGEHGGLGRTPPPLPSLCAAAPDTPPNSP